MVSVCLPSDALLQHLPSYSCFSYLENGVSFHSCSSKAQPLLLTLDEGYLLTTTFPDLQRGIAPLGPPAPVQPQLLGRGVSPPSPRPWPRTQGNSFRRHHHHTILKFLEIKIYNASCYLCIYSHLREFKLSNKLTLLNKKMCDLILRHFRTKCIK